MSITYNTRSVVSVRESNNAVVNGNLFQASHKFTIPAGGTYNLTYKTPVGLSVEAYPTVLATSADNLTLEFRENAVVSGGTLHQAFNLICQEVLHLYRWEMNCQGLSVLE